MNKYWLQVFVHYDRNVDFINNVNDQGVEVIAKRYRSSNGMFEYELRSNFQANLSELMVEYNTEDYSFESSNLDYEFQYPDGI